MWLTNFQTLLILLQLAICEAEDGPALPHMYSPSHILTAFAASSNPFLNIKHAIDPKVVGSTTTSAYSSWTTWSCPPGSTWTTLRPFAGCRTTASVQAPMYTGCANVSVRLGPFDNDTCTGTHAQTSCITGRIHYGDNVTYTNFDCWPTWVQGDWEAWREPPSGLPLAAVVAAAVVIPVVTVAVVVAGLWWWRRRRQRRHRAELLNGLDTTETEMKPDVPEYTAVSPGVKTAQVFGSKELDEQRRRSELSATIAPQETVGDPIGRVEEEGDDASSYHSAASRFARHELYGQQPAAGGSRGTGQELQDGGMLQKVLQSFHL